MCQQGRYGLTKRWQRHYHGIGHRDDLLAVEQPSQLALLPFLPALPSSSRDPPHILGAALSPKKENSRIGFRGLRPSQDKRRSANILPPCTTSTYPSRNIRTLILLP